MGVLTDVQYSQATAGQHHYRSAVRMCCVGKKYLYSGLRGVEAIFAAINLMDEQRLRPMFGAGCWSVIQALRMLLCGRG